MRLCIVIDTGYNPCWDIVFNEGRRHYSTTNDIIKLIKVS